MAFSHVETYTSLQTKRCGLKIRLIVERYRHDRHTLNFNSVFSNYCLFSQTIIVNFLKKHLLPFLTGALQVAEGRVKWGLSCRKIYIRKAFYCCFLTGTPQL